MSKHTPGPWVARQSGAFNLAAFDIEAKAANRAGGGTRLVTCLASTTDSPAHEDEIMAANALLIAAAPELLEALESAVREHCAKDPCRCVQRWHEPAKAAIRKAKGTP